MSVINSVIKDGNVTIPLAEFQKFEDYMEQAEKGLAEREKKFAERQAEFNEKLKETPFIWEVITKTRNHGREQETVTQTKYMTNDPNIEGVIGEWKAQIARESQEGVNFLAKLSIWELIKWRLRRGKK